jgi:hypothetical protein
MVAGRHALATPSHCRRATDLSDTIGAFWMVPLPLRKYRDDGLVDVPAALVAALQERS